MPIRINENIFSLFINRNLVRVNQDLEAVYRRLGSGEKITRAADDPAGLANSHQLRSKISGLQRNVTNVQQGQNFLNVAESALGNQTDMLQRLRELAIQASSDTVSDEQRGFIQEEVEALLTEFERIATTANYNDRKLLDGTFQDLRLQVGTRKDEGIPIRIADSRISAVGQVASATGALTVNATPIVNPGDLTINGIDIPASEFDGVSTFDGDASALAKATAINAVSDDTGVRATAEPAVQDDPAAQVQGGTLDGTTSSLIINGVNIGPVSYGSDDADRALTDRINALENLTGVSASIGLNGQLVLSTEDGRNLSVVTTGGVAQDLGLSAAPGDVNLQLRGSITLTSPDTIDIDAGEVLIGFSAAQTSINPDPATAIEFISLATFEGAQQSLLTIDTALSQIIGRRSALGAVQSRLDQTLEDLLLNIENLTSADSRIRDADFAVESSRLTQSQIIQEAGVAILAQANVVPRQALSLLQN